MMYYALDFPWIPVIGLLHTIAALSFVFGLLSLMIWAWKTWKPHTYRKAGLWMIAIALISALLCGAALAMGVGFDKTIKKGKRGDTMMRGAAYDREDCIYQ